MIRNKELLTKSTEASLCSLRGFHFAYSRLMDLAERKKELTQRFTEQAQSFTETEK